MSSEALVGEDQRSLGFFGKLPSRGDFVSRQLPRGFVEPWDTWLQGAIATSKDELGDKWLDYYLTWPIWHFVLGAGFCGQDQWCGVMMPSVDRVGRYFPITVAANVGVDVGLFTLLTANHSWFSAIDEVLLAVLEEDAITPDELGERVLAMGRPTAVSAGTRDLAAASVKEPSDVINSRIDASETGLAASFLLDAVISRRLQSCSLWWSSGSDHVAGGLSIADGLPASAGFVAMMDGNWESAGWRVAGHIGDKRAGSDT